MVEISRRNPGECIEGKDDAIAYLNAAAETGDPTLLQVAIGDVAKARGMGQVAKEAGEKFLAENGKKEGIITTKSGLQYQVLREGNGKAPKATDQVECHYEGTLIDGTKFDSSYDRGQTATFPLNQVIAGWTEGLQLMTEEIGRAHV